MGTPKPDNQVTTAVKTGAKPYGKVVLTLKNCLLPEEKLSPTPSQLDGLDQGTEIDLRILGCELIQTAGILLKLPQVAMATGQVLFQRFYYSKSFVRHAMETTAMGCVCLASKIEEAPRRIRDVINVFYHVKQVKNGKYIAKCLLRIGKNVPDMVNRTIQPMILDQNYIALKTQVIKAERRVLKELGFCVHVKHPHKIIVMYLQVLSFEKHQALMQIAWNYMNDSLRTDVFVRYQPETVACACIYLTARRLRICLPRSPPWYAVFRVKETDIQDVCKTILRLYKRPKPNAEELERRVEELMKQYQEARVKARSAGSATPLGGESPASSSRASSPVPSAPGPSAVTSTTSTTLPTNHNNLPPPAVTLTSVPNSNSSNLIPSSSTSSRSNSHYVREGSHHSSHRHRRSRRSSASPTKKNSRGADSPQRWTSYSSSKNNHNNSSASMDRHGGRGGDRSRSNSLSRSPPPSLPPPPIPASSVVVTENSSSSRRRRNKSSRKSRRSSSGSPSASGQTRSRSRSRERSRKKTSSRSKSSRRSYSRSVSPQPIVTQSSSTLQSQNSILSSQAQISQLGSLRQSSSRNRERGEKVRYRSRSRSHERDRSRDDRFYEHYEKSLSSTVAGVKVSSSGKHHHREVDEDYLSSSLRSTSSSGRSSTKESRR